MNTIRQLIYQKNWNHLINQYLQKEICSVLNFTEAMWLTKYLIYSDMHNEENQQYGLKLIFEIKSHFVFEWEKDWKNDIFLGDICSFLCLYDEQYISYKSAYDKLIEPPASLLLLLAGCRNAPGNPPITEEEAEFYLRRAAEKKITFETALMMRSLYERKGNYSQAKHWDKLYKTLEKQHICSDLLLPDIFTK